jgi:hypothetical protein
MRLEELEKTGNFLPHRELGWSERNRVPLTKHCKHLAAKLHLFRNKSALTSKIMICCPEPSFGPPKSIVSTSVQVNSTFPIHDETCWG